MELPRGPFNGSLSMGPSTLLRTNPSKKHIFGQSPDMLFNDSENLKKRFGQGALRELDPAISSASALMVRTEGWKLAVSSRGFLAFVPEETRKGDMMSVIKDSEVPFILRSGEKGYSMTGECYVRGVMDGEAYDVMESNGSTGKIKLI